MTEKQFMESSRMMLDSETHLCAASFSDGKLNLGMHGRIDEIVALGVKAIIEAAKKAKSPKQTHLLLKAAAAMLIEVAE